jgi:hypothetical protein
MSGLKSGPISEASAGANTGVSPLRFASVEMTKFGWWLRSGFVRFASEEQPEMQEQTVAGLMDGGGVV